MNHLRILKLTLSGIAGFLIGIILFFPWGSAGDSIIAKALAVAAENGIYATVGKNLVRGTVDKELVCLGIQAELPVLRLYIKEASANPMLLRSIFTAVPSFTVMFEKSTVKPFAGKELECRSGTAVVSLDGGTAYIKDIKLDGDFSVKGFIELSTETGIIRSAKLMIRIPEEMDKTLQMLSSAGIVHAVRVRPGEWDVER